MSQISVVTVQHGSADTVVVRAMNVKYGRLGGGPVTPKPLNRFR